MTDEQTEAACAAYDNFAMNGDGDPHRNAMRLALEAAERAAWRDAADAPWGVEFHVERSGDLIRVERYSCPWPDIVKPTVINNRTGRWWTFDHWRHLPDPPR